MQRAANFCPRCGHALHPAEVHGRMRPVCAGCDFIFYFDPKVAVLVVIVQNEKVLLVQRANDPGKGSWACPAGFVEHDESPEDAAVREVLEETGLVIRVERLLDVFPKKDHGLADLVIAYEARILNGTMQAADDAADVRWFGRDELPELVFYPSQTLVGTRWRNGNLYGREIP